MGRPAISRLSSQSCWSGGTLRGLGADRSGSGIGGQIIMAVRRKDRGIDVGIAVVPEADTVTPDGVIVDVVDGERPEHRPDPTISAVDVSPPPVRDVAAMPARQRCSRDDLPAHRWIAKSGTRRVVGVLRSEGSRSDFALTGKGTTVMQSPERQYAGYCDSGDPKGADAKTHSGHGRTRQQGCQNDSGNSNADLRHGPSRVKSSCKSLRAKASCPSLRA